MYVAKLVTKILFLLYFLPDFAALYGMLRVCCTFLLMSHHIFIAMAPFSQHVAQDIEAQCLLWVDVYSGTLALLLV